MNTKFVLGLNRPKQLGLEHLQKNLRGCDHHPRIPLPGMVLITDSMFFFTPSQPQTEEFLAALSNSRSVVVGRSVGPLVRRSVGPSVRRSVGP